MIDETPEPPVSLETAGPTKPPTEGDLASSRAGKRAFLALGIERLGLISLRFPWLVAILALALGIAAGFGVVRLKVDDSLSQLFRSDTPEFRQYEEVTRKFPSSEFDVLVVVEGKRCSQRDSLEKLRDFVTDVQLVDGVRGIISLFSARQPPEGRAHARRRCFPRHCRKAPITTPSSRK